MMDITLRRFIKLYAIVLVSFIVEATSSNINDTSHEHRQSRVTGRIVKLYSGSRPEPILCADEGFQADPHDCAVFYRCMKSGSGKYTVFRFQCGPGTVYDPETEVCNHPRSTKRSECGGLLPPLAAAVDRLNNNEIEGTLNEIPSPIINRPIRIESTTGAKATFTTLNPWTASSSTILAHNSTKRHTPEVSTGFTSPFPWGSTLGHTKVDYTVNPLNLPQNTVTKNQKTTMVSKVNYLPNTSAKPQSNAQNNICSSDGFMGDSENCRKFYRCVANQRGTYTRFEFSCSETTVWDDDTQSCNHAWAVKRTRCGRSNQDNLFTTNADIPKKDSSTDKTIQQQLQLSFGSKVTQTQTQISNGSTIIQNQTQINYGDRLNQNKDTQAKQNQTQISHGSAVSQTQTQVDYSDKGVQTQLQIDHSQQASQTQIQVHESTTSGSSTSTASSTSHANTQNGNRCGRSGFMGDPNDCKKFYRCIENGRGGYTKFEFSCGEGTVWDQSIEACNHAWAVKDCGGKSSADTTSTTQGTISTSQSTQNYYTTTSNENHHTTSELIDTEENEDSGYGQQNQKPSTSSSTTLSSTTAGSTTAKSPSNGNCQSSGFIGDANDCKIFYRCVENGKGSFTKYEFKCGEGTVWDPDIEACNHAWAVKRCGGTASPDINKVETTTEQQNTLSTANTQSTKVTQAQPTESAATQIDDYDIGYGPEHNDVTSSTTTTTKKPQNEKPSVSTVCKFSGFMGDENDCKKFYRCVDNGNGGYTRYEFTCGEGTVWDSKIDACNHAWAVEKCGGSTVDHQESTTQAKPTTTHEIIDSSSTEGDTNTGSSTILPSTASSTSIVTESVSVSSNNCTKSGFMGDQKDCKKFYRCVDNGQGSFTKYEFSCGEGTVWDQEIEACNHAWAVKKCGGTADSSIDHQETTTQFHPTLSDEIDNGYPSNIDSGAEITTQSPTTQSTSESSKEPSEGNNCISSGFIGDKNDCKKFYRCVDDGNGKYIRYEFSCGEGTLWDQSIEACNHAWAVKDCGKTGNTTAHPSSESPTQGTSATETEDHGYPQSTEKTSTSTVSSYPDSEQGEACAQEGFIGDKRNCKKFYRCVDNGRGGFTKYEFTCGEGTYWNQEIVACDHATSDQTCGEKESSSSTQTSQPEHDEIYTEATSMSSVSTGGNVNEQTQQPPASYGICTSEGFYGDQNDCKKFYRCVDNGKGGYNKYDFTCGDGTVWDQEIQACNHESSNKKCFAGSPPTTQTTEKQPDTGNNISMTTASQIQHSTEKTDTSSTSTSSSFQCSSEGFFADPNSCKNFIRCVSNEKGGFTKYEFTCGDGTIWVQDIQTCDHDTGDTVCNTQSTGRPSATEAHHQTTENNEVVTFTSEPQTIDKQEDEYDNGNVNKPTQSGSGDCSSEGFYGNENDCRQFYRCVDNGQGGYTKYDFTCGDGTAWDSEIQSCNHIEQVKTCKGFSEIQPVMHDEDNSPSTESSSTTSSGSTSSSTTSSGTTTSDATSSSTTSSSTSTSGSNNQNTTTVNKDTCDSEGYFGNTQDCKKFYRCVDNGKGGYTKYDFDCGDGTIWDQDITTCNHPQDVVNPSCNQNGSNGIDESTTSTTMASSSSSGEPSSTSESSASSDSSLTTSSSQSTTESIQGSSNCSQEDTSKKPTNQNITCDRAGYFANPNDCKKFYRCVDWDGDGKRFSVYHFDCGEGTIWDPAVETCNHEESVYPPRDCSGSQSESQPATEGSTTTQQETTSTQESTSTQTTSTTKSSTEQTTESTTSEPTTTQQSTSSEKTTTQQSTTSEQTTTEQTTQQSTTSEKTTQQSTTSEQTTQQSTTSEQTSQPPTSEQTSTQQSTTSEKTTTQQSTTSEQTTTQQSTTSEKTTTEQATTSEQTTTQQSTSSEQTTQEPNTSEQTTQESTTSEQTTQESTTSEQTTQASTTTEQSTTSEKTTTEQSTTSESTTEQSNLTSESSTTEQSTTQQSTTTEQSEQSTTEESTTNEGATTEQSTTEQSTTEQMNGSSSTESGTDESTSEKKCPETDENQSLFVCPTSFKRHPKYCNLFYQCDEDDDTHDVKIAVFTCPNNTIYDESQTRCVEEGKADKKCDGKIAQKRRFKRLDKHYKEPLVATKDSHACPSAGYFSFEKDSECSTAFLKCKTDKTNKLRGLVYQCPSGFLYWSISKRCEPMNRVRDCKRSQNNWSGRWEIPVERRNVAPS